jgi:polar amino acid transport system substrate-binding protein
MKKVFSIFTVALSIVTLFSLISCSETIDSKYLKIGVDDSYPPMEYKDEKSNTIGFDIDVAKEIARRLGKEPQFVSTAWDGIFSALNTRKFDCIISSMSMTAKRLEEFTFTKPYIATSQMIIVNPNVNSITKPEDLAGKKVGCQVSTTAHEAAIKIQAKGTKFAELKIYDQVIQPFADMKAGRLDAIIVDEVVGLYYIGLDKANFKSASAKLTNEPIGVCLKKGNTVLADKIQKAIDAMVADGTMKQISLQWFNADLTSNIDTVLKEMN